MPRYKLTIEYAGTRYSGWQKQKNARTVQGEIERAIGEATREKAFEFMGSGRTDAGVHALRQVAHLDVRKAVPPDLNALQAGILTGTLANLITGAWTDRLSEEDARAALGEAVAAVNPGEGFAGKVRDLIRIPPAALGEMWKSPRGRDIARRWAFLDLSYEDYVRLPTFLLVSAVIRAGAFDAFGPDRCFWGTDITRMPCSWRQCVTMFTEELPWLRGRDLERVMGAAIVDWLGWKRPAAR